MKDFLSKTLAFSLLIMSACSLLPAADDYPLPEAGSYHVGVRKIVGYKDASRDGRQIYLTIWYPTRS